MAIPQKIIFFLFILAISGTAAVCSERKGDYVTEMSARMAKIENADDLQNPSAYFSERTEQLVGESTTKVWTHKFQQKEVFPHHFPHLQAVQNRLTLKDAKMVFCATGCVTFQDDSLEYYLYSDVVGSERQNYVNIYSCRISGTDILSLFMPFIQKHLPSKLTIGVKCAGCPVALFQKLGFQSPVKEYLGHAADLLWGHALKATAKT